MFFLILLQTYIFFSKTYAVLLKKSYGSPHFEPKKKTTKRETNEKRIIKEHISIRTKICNYI